ncbi:MAG: hypothetical protein E6J90_27510 [Deltaproteobacteria bacterium]|nr:MAG: hypothetical protein E6J90_27510 [Deltaproteobacteria bacterium]
MPSLGTSDYKVTAELIVPAGSLFSGIIARTATINTDETMYAAQLATDGHVNLYRRNAYTWTLLAAQAATITAGVQYTVKLVVSGSSLAVYFGNESTPAISATDGAIATGNFGGLHGFTGTAGSVTWDDFNITGATSSALFSDTFDPAAQIAMRAKFPDDTKLFLPKASRAAPASGRRRGCPWSADLPPRRRRRRWSAAGSGGLRCEYVPRPHILPARARRRARERRAPRLRRARGHHERPGGSPGRAAGSGVRDRHGERAQR